MRTLIERGALDDCANGVASYGMICVGCNCCGRFDEDKGDSLTNEQKQERVNAWWAGMEEAERICHKSGNEEIKPEDRFCKICGTKLTDSGE